MKVFISVGMRGRSDEEIKSDIERAKRKLLAGEPDTVFEFVDNMVNPPEGTTQKLYSLGEAIKILGECDACFFCKGWENYNGCNVEHMVCDCYDIAEYEEV